VNLEGLPFSAALANRKNAVVNRWFSRVLQTYPESATGFLSQEKDPFRNPVGHTLKTGLSTLFDGLVQPADVAALTPALDDIVRIRAVQDLTAGQAVSFPFLLKQILREEFAADTSRYSGAFEALELKIDELALLAFDLYMKCRQQVFEIKANEIKRRTFILEKAQQRGQ
jgi:hypothetical protein